MKITPVILCGGSGTRLWPLSRQHYPKQFLELIDNTSLFQQSLARAACLNNKDFEINEILIITNEHHRFLVLEQLAQTNLNLPTRIILEPEPKNTAPALTLGALAANEMDKDSILIVFPADQYIKDNNFFKKTIHRSIKALKDKTIVTIGVSPNSADTGFGYIKFEGDDTIKTVLSFKEKPSLEIAKKMISSGEYAWNSGMFILSSRTWLDAIYKSNLKIFEKISISWNKKKVDQWFERPDPNSFHQSPEDSIDYAVMERALSLGITIKLILLNAGWSDLGSFSALIDIEDKDENGNSFKGDVVSINSKNNLVISNKKNLSLVGINNLIIIETADSILIANKNDSQSIKSLVSILEKNHSHLIKEHLKVYRPWGWFETVDEAEGFKVKRIYVNPRAKLSYQSHKFRNEHWVVVKGKASIIVDGQQLTLNNDESTYIKKGTKHQLMNYEDDPLEIIEVQTGEKITENDIQRFEDQYGRD